MKRWTQEIRVQFAGAGAASAVVPALAYAAVRTLAKLLTALAPMSGLVALAMTLVWLASALYVFAVITWQRDDNWLAAGIIIALTLFCGGLIADLVARVAQTEQMGSALLATLEMSIGLLVRSIILAPLSGGFVFGARWLTSEARRSGALT